MRRITVAGDNPPPRSSALRRTAMRTRSWRGTVPVGGSRSPPASGVSYESDRRILLNQARGPFVEAREPHEDSLSGFSGAHEERDPGRETVAFPAEERQHPPQAWPSSRASAYGRRRFDSALLSVANLLTNRNAMPVRGPEARLPHAPGLVLWRTHNTIEGSGTDDEP